LQLDRRKRDVMLAITRKVRFFSFDQVDRAWYEDAREARRTLKMLCDAGLIQKFTVSAHPEIPTTDAVVTWSPGAPPPDFGAVSYVLQTRWQEPVGPVSVFTATAKAARYFAGYGGRLKRPLQATHDLHVASIYLEFLKHRPIDAKAWISEDGLGPIKRREKRPDALLQYGDGRPPVVIEFGGSYRRERVLKVHAHCAARGLSYELW